MNDNLIPENASESMEFTFRRVLMSARRYWMVIVCSLVIANIAAAIYFSKAEPKFESSSAIMVQHSSPNSNYLETPVEREIQGYADLFVSDAVLSKALDSLHGLPAEINTESPKEYWPSQLSQMLEISPRRSSNIIDLSCISAEPDTCVDVLNAVVNSAMNVFGETQKNHALELVRSLDSERREIEERLMDKEVHLLDARRNCGDFGISNNAKALHPLVQTAVKLNDTLIELQKKKLALETLRQQVSTTMQLGGNLLQHMERFESLVGQEFSMSPFGTTKYDVQSLGKVRDQLRQEQQRLEEVNRFYGPAHPKHATAMKAVLHTQSRIDAIQSQVEQGLNDEATGARLLEIVDASIQNAASEELALTRQYAAAEQKALSLNDKLSQVAMLDREVTLLRGQHDSLLERIADIDVNLDRANIQFVVVSDPMLPTSPKFPNAKQTFSIATLLGAFAAAGLIWLIELFHGKFVGVEQIESEVGERVLAVVGKIPQALGRTGWNAVHSFDSPQSIHSEGFRTLRASIGFATAETSCISITSSEPGDGKTTVVSNLATSFAQANVRCLLIDADMRKPGMSKLVGKRGMLGLSDVLRSDENLPDLVQQRVQSTGNENLEFLSCGSKPADPSALLSSARMEELLGWASRHYDQVIVDCPPALIASDATIVGRLVDSVLLVVNPDKNHRKAILRTNEALRSSGVEVAGLVLNNASIAVAKSYYGYGKGYGHHYYDDRDETPADDSAAAELAATIPFPVQPTAQPAAATAAELTTGEYQSTTAAAATTGQQTANGQAAAAVSQSLTNRRLAAITAPKKTSITKRTASRPAPRATIPLELTVSTATDSSSPSENAANDPYREVQRDQLLAARNRQTPQRSRSKPALKTVHPAPSDSPVPTVAKRPTRSRPTLRRRAA